MSVPYVYVASSWRNPVHAEVCAALAAVGVDHYDFKNPPGGTGFSWKQVKTAEASAGVPCEHCGRLVAYGTFRQLGRYEPDYDPARDPAVWRHTVTGYAGCGIGGTFAAPKKGSDWEPVDEYLRMRMVNHPVAVDGFVSDFGAMRAADAFIMVLPCGKSAHLELGWAVGAGKRTAILLEDPVEPELMYLMVDKMTRSIVDVVDWARQA